MKNILILLIIFTGIVFFPTEYTRNIVHIPQEGFLFFSSGILISCLIWKYSKIVSAMSVIVACVFMITLLEGSNPIISIYNSYLYSSCLFLIFYFVRDKKINENTLKWSLIPSVINIIIVFIQELCPSLIPLKSSTIGASGLLGSGGLTATFIGMTTPLFLRWLPIMIPFLLMAIIFCKGFIGFLCFFSACIIYLLRKSRIAMVLCSSVLVGMIIFTIIKYPTFINYRISAFLGTLDGIIHHPMVGWGVGDRFFYLHNFKSSSNRKCLLCRTFQYSY